MHVFASYSSSMPSRTNHKLNCIFLYLGWENGSSGSKCNKIGFLHTLWLPWLQGK